MANIATIVTTRFFMVNLLGGSSLVAAANDVEIDRDDDDRASHHGLPLLRNGQDAQAIGENADHECADHGAEDRALSAAQRGAPDDDGGDRVELVTEAERRLR